MNNMKKYALKTITTKSFDILMCLFVKKETFQIHVQFSCLENQRIFNDKLIIFSDPGEDHFDFIERSENIIEIELHRIKRNLKINNILKKNK